MIAMVSNIFKVFALIPLLQCAYTMEAENEFCVPLDGTINTTLHTNVTSKTITANKHSIKKAPWTGSNVICMYIGDFMCENKVVPGQTKEVVKGLINTYKGVNVIEVDICTVLKNQTYVNGVVKGMPLITKQIFDILNVTIHERVEITVINVLAHGYGAQCAGKLGKYCKANGITLNLIEALDPTKACFERNELSADVAVDVHVYHSSNLGVGALSGSLDIFLGDNKNLPYCPSENYKSMDMCLHVFAVRFYIELLAGKSISGITCVDLSLYKKLGCHPKDKCEDAYHCFGHLDVATQTNICLLNGGETVNLTLSIDKPSPTGVVLIEAAILAKLDLVV